MKVAIASDHGGLKIRKEIISLLKEMNISGSGAKITR